MALLNLVPIYLEQQKLLPPVARQVERVFGMTTAIRPPDFDAEQCFDPTRGQYNSTILLAYLGRNAENGRVLGVTSVDLFIPVLTFVIGEAQLGGKAAVVSIYRLRNEVYGLPPDPVVLDQRLRKETFHELGHTFGLTHCRDDLCVMRASGTVEEIDVKPDAFCPDCLRLLRTRIPPKGRSVRGVE